MYKTIKSPPHLFRLYGREAKCSEQGLLELMDGESEPEQCDNYT